MKRSLTKLTFSVSLILCLALLMSSGSAFALTLKSPLTPVSASNFDSFQVTNAKTEALPSYYSSADLGYVTSVKNQGLHGTCWAFTTAAVAEASVLRHNTTINGETPDKESLDFSEGQIAYFTYHDGTDPLGTLGGDTSVYAHDDWLECGGNQIYTSLTLMAWKGLADDSVLPYDSITEGSHFDAEIAGEASVRMENAFWFNMSDVATAKKMIMEHGAIFTNYMHHENFLVHTTGAYYCPNRYVTNHAITVIGWDDDYSKENFATAPATDGAWLVKNSWGEHWGDNGYGWISYCDGTLSMEDAAAFTFADVEKYDNNYQYDGTLNTSYAILPNGTYMANNYTVCSDESGYERIDSIAIGLYSPSVNYSVQIYKNAEGFNTLEGEPLLEKPITGTTHTAGYHNIPLGEEIILKNGDNFTVLVQCESNTESEFHFLTDSNGTVNNDFIFINDTENDKSFYGQEFGGTVYFGSLELQTDNIHTARIKAYTSDIASYRLKLANLDADTTEGFVDIGDDLKVSLIKAENVVFPETIRVTFHGFDTDNYDYNKETGEITVYDVQGNVEIYAAGTKIQTSFEITVNGITQNCTAGRNATFATPSTKDINGVTYTFFRWNCNVEGILSNERDNPVTITMPYQNVELTAEYYIPGDLDGDETVTAIDALRLTLMIKGTVDTDMRADLNGDGKLTAADVLEFNLIMKGLL